MRRIRPLFIPMTLVSLLVLFGCSNAPRTLSTVPPPTGTTTPVPTTTASVPPPTGAIINSWGWEGNLNDQIKGGQNILFPNLGAQVDPGKYLTVTWEADGTVQVWLLNSEQYHNFLNGKPVSGSLGQALSAKGSFTYKTTAADQYYVIVKNVYPDATVVVRQARMDER